MCVIGLDPADSSRRADPGSVDAERAHPKASSGQQHPPTSGEPAPITFRVRANGRSFIGWASACSSPKAVCCLTGHPSPAPSARTPTIRRGANSAAAS